MATYNSSLDWYNDFAEQHGKGVHQLASHTLKMLLCSSSYTFSAAHAVLADISAELSGSGYARQTLANKQWIEASGVGKLTFDNIQFSASGGNLTARRWVLFNDSVSDPLKPLICSGLINSADQDVTITDGNIITLNCPAGGLFQLSMIGV
jgi:hypothetical protein